MSSNCQSCFHRVLLKCRKAGLMVITRQYLFIIYSKESASVLSSCELHKTEVDVCLAEVYHRIRVADSLVHSHVYS